MKKRAAPRIAAGAAVLLLAFSGIPASALIPGQSYVYDAFYQPVYSPDAYTASRLGSLKLPVPSVAPEITRDAV